MNLANLPQLPTDKANHALYGAVCSVAGVALAGHFGFPLAPAALISAGAAGVLKEVADKVTGKGTKDHLDAIATAAGGLPAALALLIAG